MAIGSRVWIDRNPEKRRAHNAVSNALRDGILRKSPCEVCGAAETTAHHEDYSRPLDVRWLCTKCHAEIHKAERIAKRDAKLPTLDDVRGILK